MWLGSWRARMQSILPFPMGGLWLKSHLWRVDFEILGTFEHCFLQTAYNEKTSGAAAKWESRMHRCWSDLSLDWLQVWSTRSQWPCLQIKQVMDPLHDLHLSWYFLVHIASCNCTDSTNVILSWGLQSYTTTEILYFGIQLKHIPW
jgi:hypothetical protein